MHVWFVCVGEPLPFQERVRLLRYGELTRLLADRGHKVTWWASDFSHMSRSYIAKPNARVTKDGVEMVLVHGSGYRRNVSLARLRHVAVHARTMARLIERETPPDIIVCAMPTLESADVMVRYGAKRGIPVILDIRDEWPEDYIRWLPGPLRALGRLALLPQFRALRRACANAVALCGVTERQLNYGLQHAGRSAGPQDRVFHLGAHGGAAPPPQEQVDAWRDRFSPGDFVCAFSGTMSPSRPLSATIAAVRRLSAQIPIKLVLAGQGDREAQYRAEAAGCPNIIFAGWLDAVQMAALNQVADVLLALYRPDYGFSMPTKIFDYMAAGRPLLSSCPGEAQALLRQEEIGIQVRENDSLDIENALLQLYRDPERRRRMGERARAVFMERFTTETIIQRFADYLENVAVPGRTD